jgi:hypothetical protein
MREQPFPPDRFQVTDTALAVWRQGDVILGSGLDMQHLAIASAPLTPAAEQALAEQQGGEPDDWLAVSSEVAGFVVLTQTCDLVRSSRKRAYVEIAPLVEVTSEAHHSIIRCRQPQFAYIPALADRRLVADLDRSMTVEKAVLAQLKRARGMLNDLDTANFQRALVRNKARFAFPDEFNLAMKKFRERMIAKTGKETPEGAHVNALIEIRVAAQPNWDAKKVGVTLWLIKGEDPDPQEWTRFVPFWEGLIDQKGRFRLDGPPRLLRLDDMRASEYLASQALDMDYLSPG